MSPRTLWEWFSTSAERYGDQPALEVAGEVVTYRELAASAGRVATALVEAAGGTSPRRVGLLARRTPAAYAGYLGVQLINGTVVPLNAAWPDARNAAVTRAAGLDLVLTDEGPLPGSAAPLVDLADALAGKSRVLSETTGTHRAGVAESDAMADAPAYILFTSGSTGTPKGVPIRQGNISAYLEHVINRYDIGPGARLSQTFDLTFDVSVFDMFTAWGGGGTLVVPDKDEVLTPVRFVAERGLTHWCSVPSVISFARRMRALRSDSMPTLRYSLFAGEPLSLQQAEAWHTAAPQSVLENIYGPTELTVTCSEYRLPADRAAWPRTSNGTVPIGRIYPHMEHLVLDEEGHPAAEGEICLRGPQRFPGYLDPADNAGRFWDLDGEHPALHDGSGAVDEHLWYRTGDRVPVGDPLIHLGRLDHQVKIFGYRVELGEIEAVLREQPGVHEAVVLALHDGSELQAVCTGKGVDSRTLLDTLRLRLPAYMVPRDVLILDELPLNTNGKTDRKALSALLSETAGR